MESTFSSFPKIFALGHRSIGSIFEEDVEISEKLDGSQIAFKSENGVLHCRSKGAIQQVDCPDRMFEAGIEYLKSIQDSIPEGYTFYGEYFRKPKHNVLVYREIPQNHIALFGVLNHSTGVFVSEHEEVARFAMNLNVGVVPILFYGKIESAEEIEKFLDTTSILGGCRVEGVVVKNYKDNWVGGQLLPLMSGKYVSERFKEIHRNNWKKENTNGGKWETYKAQFCTPARWEKAIIHLKESGELEGDPRDIGKLMKEVQIDVTKECQEEIKDWLWKHFGKEVIKGAARGLPEWYKEQLLKDAFLQEV